MQILENTSMSLVIYSRPLGLWLFTTALVLFGPITLLVNRDILMQEDGEFLLSLAPFIISWFAVAGWFFFKNMQTITSTFSKDTQLFIQQRQTLLGLRSKQYTLGEIEDILILGSDGEGIPINPIQVLLKSGEKIPVYLQLDFFKALPTATETASLLRQFLELDKD